MVAGESAAHAWKRQHGSPKSSSLSWWDERGATLNYSDAQVIFGNHQSVQSQRYLKSGLLRSEWSSFVRSRARALLAPPSHSVEPKSVLGAVPQAPPTKSTHLIDYQGSRFVERASALCAEKTWPWQRRRSA
eukprot:scaffold7381_cov310-Pinguiococcus_pyrenoidosus.AAC.34